jgi:hypothetical protein
MIITYTVKAGRTETDFNSRDARAALDAAMRYAERLVNAGRDVTVLRDGNIVWTSQKPLTTATN